MTTTRKSNTQKGLSPLNGDQLLAIEFFQKALTRLSTVGLNLVGIDSYLYVYTTESWDKVRQGIESPIERINELDHEIIQSRTYIDSGGF